jgi:hypothetical protein
MSTKPLTDLQHVENAHRSGRWTRRRRAALLACIGRGEVSPGEALARYGVTTEELESWIDRPIRSKAKPAEPPAAWEPSPSRGLFAWLWCWLTGGHVFRQAGRHGLMLQCKHCGYAKTNIRKAMEVGHG